MILSIETSTPICSIALHRDGILAAFFELRIDKSHSGQLTLMIQNLLERAGVKMCELEAIAVSEGPGSYTGLRIGVSTAKGICFANNLPLININTLESMAVEMNNGLLATNTFYCPMLDARRMEVYCAIYDQDCKILHETEAKIIDENSFSELLDKGTLVLAGPGSAKCKSILKHPKLHYLDDIEPSAKGIGELAHKKYQNKEFADLAYFEPFYLKDFIAKKPSKKLL